MNRANSTLGVERAAGLTSRTITGDLAGLTAEVITPLTSESVTRRHYKPRARRCKCGCGQMVTPTANAPHKKYFDDACRQRDHRRRIAKTRKASPADPILEVVHCAYCGGSFFAEASKDARYCSQSHRTAAWRQRREAAVTALTSDLANMTEQEVADLIETTGMAKISRYLRQQGYVYDENQRAWMIPLQSGNVFVPTDVLSQPSETAVNEAVGEGRGHSNFLLESQ